MTVSFPLVNSIMKLLIEFFCFASDEISALEGIGQKRSINPAASLTLTFVTLLIPIRSGRISNPFYPSRLCAFAWQRVSSFEK